MRRDKTTTAADQGFTIVELMIAMAVFSIILLAAAAGLIQVGRMYYKSVITSRTQDMARSVSEEITSAIQFSGETLVMGSGSGFESICIGNTRYSYVLNQQLSDDNDDIEHVLWRDKKEDNACTPADLSGSLSDGVELMGENMRLYQFDVTTDQGNDYKIATEVVYGDSDLLVGVKADGEIVDDYDDPDAVRLICDPDGIGTQFCAVAELSSVVARRL